MNKNTSISEYPVKPIDLNVIAKEYKSVITAFKNLPDVQNARLISYHDNQDPKGNLRPENWASAYGDAITTTGYCVSVSRAFNEWAAFQRLLSVRGAKSKLISIDIKEQYWGYCYNGLKNTYHTAVLVFDSGELFIIDLTCAQFGNRFVGKDIWSFKTWERTFRSPLCTHSITDFAGNTLTTYGNESIKEKMLLDSKYTVDFEYERIRKELEKLVQFSPVEVDELAKFFIGGIDTANAELYYGYLNEYNPSKLNFVNNLLSKFNSVYVENMLYSVIKFDNMLSAKLYIKKLISNGNNLFNYLKLFTTLDNATKEIGCNSSNINRQDSTEDSISYIVFEFKNLNACIDTNSLLNYYIAPFGMELPIATENIFNGEKRLDNTLLKMDKTNTIYIVL